MGDNQEDSKNHSTRWRYYIDRQFQNRFMARFALIIVIVGVTALAAIWLVRSEPYGLLPGGSGVLFSADTELSEETGGFVPEETYNAFDLYWPPILIVSLVNLLMVTIFGLFYSHSMAGPIHNIKESLNDMVDDGEARPIRIRKGDQFQDLVDLLNKLIEKRVK